jgi:hypothetical protein
LKNRITRLASVILLLLFTASVFSSCNKTKEEPASAACDILMFSVDALTWNIEGTAISHNYPADKTTEPLAPVITVSPGATVNPPSGTAQNLFTAEGIAYTVTAEDRVTTKTYTARATKSLYTDCLVLSFTVDADTVKWDIVDDTLITRTYTMEQEETLMTPVFTLSPGATVNPPAGTAQNFFTPAGVHYTVTSEDGTKTNSYTVRAKRVSSECNIISFSVGDEQWTIDDTIITYTYSTEMPQVYMVPTIVLSPGAKVSPATTVSQNFFAPGGVRYTVTSEDRSATKTYIVYAFHVYSGRTGDCIWTLSDAKDTLTISGSGAMADYVGTEEDNGIIKTPWIQHNNSITTIIVAEGVTRLGNNAFRGVSSVEPDQIMYGELKTVILSSTVKTTGYAVFAYCHNITTVTMGNSLESIGDFTFYDCSSLETVVIPNSVKTLGMAAFNGCFSLHTVSLGNSITSIGEYAFMQCRNLNYITIPGSVTTIAGQAFGYCVTLTGVTNQRGIPQNIAGAEIFNNVSIDRLTLKVPSGSVDAYRSNEEWNKFGTITGI